MKVERSKTHVVVHLTPREVEQLITLLGPVTPLSAPSAFLKGWREMLRAAQEILETP